ncbi:26S proteasome complex subunit [Elasticomyces elasticus]|nr:26S proteasome complex subunit [Elasticomyces elasticus]
MSGSTQTNAEAGKLRPDVPDAKDDSKPLQAQKPTQLDEDDEFEDFPVEDWSKEEEVGAQASNTHLWEESWDDDDTSDDFSVQLKKGRVKEDGWTQEVIGWHGKGMSIALQHKRRSLALQIKELRTTWAAWTIRIPTYGTSRT